MLSRKALFTIGLCLAGLFGATSAAHAAFPGANGKIAFVRFDGNSDQIFTINPNGSGESQLTFGQQTSRTPSWSPNGQLITFCRGDCSLFGSSSEIWVMNADGTDQHQVPNTGPNDIQPAFVDNSRIVFVRVLAFNHTQLWLINADGGGLDQLTDSPQTPPPPQWDQNPTGAPNGQAIEFSRGDFGDQVIYMIPTVGGSATPITNNHGGTNIWDDEPNYSPDGGTIAFQRCPTSEGCDDMPPSPANLFTVPALGGSTTQITNSTTSSEGANCQPAYAPDGSRIVFAQFPDDLNCEQQTLLSAPGSRAATSSDGLAFIGPSGGGVQGFVAGFSPDWQPTGSPAAAGGAAPVVAAPPVAFCFGAKVTIYGTNHRDKIIGTPGDDVIHGFRGKDKINGKGGDDILCGGRGKDKILGKSGDDILIGGKQSDYLNGGSGKNRLFGGTPGAPEQKFNNVCVSGPNDKLTNCQIVK